MFSVPFLVDVRHSHSRTIITKADHLGLKRLGLGVCVGGPPVGCRDLALNLVHVLCGWKKGRGGGGELVTKVRWRSGISNLRASSTLRCCHAGTGTYH